MANKKTTLKTQTGDNVYPNVLKENLPASTVFYGDEAAGPEGGVETPAGGGVNGLESDAEGNLTASKNLKVSGNLELDGNIINKIYQNNGRNPTGKMFLTFNRWDGTTTHLTQVGDTTSAAGGYPNEWYGRPVRSEDHGCLQVVYARGEKTNLIEDWIQLKLYYHFVVLTSGNSVITFTMRETRQSKINQRNIAEAIASGISANGIIVSDGSSSQVIAIKIIDNKPYAMLTDKTTVDISTYTITDTVQEQATYWG